MENPEFAKYVRLMKMKVPLQSLMLEIKANKNIKEDDLLLFAKPAEIEKMKNLKLYTGKRFKWDNIKDKLRYQNF